MSLPPVPVRSALASAGRGGLREEHLDQRFCSFVSEHPHPSRRAKGCQFEDAPLYWAGDRTYCIFHLPLDTAITPHALSSEGFGFAGTKRKWSTEENEDLSRYLKTLTIQARVPVVDLTGVVFPSDSFFREAALNSALLGECTFHSRSGSFSFVGTQFSGDQTWFQYAKFVSPVQFTDARFLGGTVWFTRCRFAGDANFSGCQFPPRGAHFPEVAFDGNAYFQNASFQRPPQFTNAVFGLAADFSSCEFPGGAQFRGAHFAGAALFPGGAETAPDPRQSQPVQAIATGYDFSETVFEGEASFAGRRFSAPVSFTDAQFHRAPVFHGTSIVEGSTFPPIDHFQSRGAPEDEARYATLKQKAAAIHLPADQEKFWILEMMSRLRSGTGSGGKIQQSLHTLYERFALYGSSLGRPFLTLAVLVLVACPVIYAVFFILVSGRRPATALLAGFRFSIAQTVRPFSAWFDAQLFPPRGVGEVDAAAVVLAALATVQSFLVLAVATVLVIAVRRRFRLA